MLLAVPNFSEGRRLGTLREIVDAFSSGDPELLDFHFDTRHNRTAVTIAGRPALLGPALLAGARAAVERIDMREHQGAHPASAPSTYARSSTCGPTTAVSRTARRSTPRSG